MWMAAKPREAMMGSSLVARRSRLSRSLAVAATTAAAIALAGTIALWVHYGTAVFYEMILAGIATCL
jgi:hypothetical protein